MIRITLALRKVSVALAAAVATVTGLAQVSEGAPAGEVPSQLTLEDLRNFSDVFNQVRQNYVESVDDRFLLEAAIDGMLAALDPHSAYLPGSDFKDLENTARGQYVGIGVDVQPRDGRLIVQSVITPSPADSAGIDPGDRILSVDGIAVKGRLLQESIDALSGPPGTTVELEVAREDEPPRKLELKRDFVKIPTLDFRLLEDRFGYFRLAYFHRNSAADFKQTLDSLAADGIVLQGVIVDLRDNPGGVLQPAVELADAFLDEGLIVTTRGRNEAAQLSFSAKPGQWLGDIPAVVLVDRGSASASEVLAGALQDHGRAVIVGERTFGKGSVQSVLPLRNGAGIKLTTARYFTPAGRSIQAAGIEPDVEVASRVEVREAPDLRKREADLEGHLNQVGTATAAGTGSSVAAEEDFPLHVAVNLLRAARTLSVNQSAVPNEIQNR